MTGSPSRPPVGWLRRFALLGALWVPAGLLAIGAGWGLMAHYQHAPLPGVVTARTIEISSGEGFAAIAHELEVQGVLGRRWPFMLLAVLEGKTRRIRAGEYRLMPGLTPQKLLDQLVNGDIRLHRLTLVEGWTFRQVRQAIQGHPELEQTIDDWRGESVMARLDRPGHSPEGQFFPDTYLFARGTPDWIVLEQAHRRLRKELASVWRTRDADLPLESPEALLTLASLIEKETAVSSERPQIAGVFIRRLRLGMPLQTDPTVIFALGADFDGNLTRAHLRQDHPYNTYRISGLPPGPIALVGRAALEAAAHPAPGRAVFFVSRGDGTHVFSETLEEHNRAVNCYQRRLCRGDAP